MKTNIKLWTMGLMTAALLGNTACTDLLHESYGQVVRGNLQFGRSDRGDPKCCRSGKNDKDNRGQ